MSNKKVVHTSGKRKEAKASAIIKAGRGKIRFNSVLLKLVEPELNRMRLMEPLELAGDVADKIDVNINASGGGRSAQIEAGRLALARGLVEYLGKDELKKVFLEYDRHLLVADTRRKEQRKPLTHSHARSKRQKSYR